MSFDKLQWRAVSWQRQGKSGQAFVFWDDEEHGWRGLLEQKDGEVMDCFEAQEEAMSIDDAAAWVEENVDFIGGWA